MKTSISIELHPQPDPVIRAKDIANGISPESGQAVSDRINELGRGDPDKGWRELWSGAMRAEVEQAGVEGSGAPKLLFLPDATPARKFARAAGALAMKASFAPVALAFPEAQAPARAFDALLSRWTLSKDRDFFAASPNTHRNSPKVMITQRVSVSGLVSLMMLARAEPLAAPGRFERAAQAMVGHELAHARFRQIARGEPERALAPLSGEPYFKNFMGEHFSRSHRTHWDAFQSDIVSRLNFGALASSLKRGLGVGPDAGALLELARPQAQLPWVNYEESFCDCHSSLQGFKQGEALGAARLSGFKAMREYGKHSADGMPGTHATSRALIALEKLVSDPALLARALASPKAMEDAALSCASVSAIHCLIEGNEVLASRRAKEKADHEAKESAQAQAKEAQESAPLRQQQEAHEKGGPRAEAEPALSVLGPTGFAARMASRREALGAQSAPARAAPSVKL